MILAGSQNFVVWQWLRVGADMSEKVLTSKGYSRISKVSPVPDDINGW